MKKIFGMSIAIMLGITMIGCEDNIEDTNIEEPEMKQEQQIEVNEPEEQEVKEEVVEAEPEKVVLNMENEDFKYHMTNNLPDEEYDKYFNDFDLKWDENGKQREMEFDGNLLLVQNREDYDTRAEVLLAQGDYNEGNFVGPYMKDKDIQYAELKGMIQEGYNVKIKAVIDKYDVEEGILYIDIKEIEQR